jgi:DNA recombination-dependent growth factor C
MPLTTGSITCRAYFLAVAPTHDVLAEGMRDLQRHSFAPPQLDRGQTRTLGWVNPRNLLDNHLAPEKILFEDFLVLGLRIDKVSLNSRMVKAYYNEAVVQALKDKRKQGLGREERLAIMEKVKMDLLARQTPSTSVYEMAWNLKTHRVYFSATSESLNLEFCDLFSDTFHTSLTPLYPFLRAETKAQKEGLMEALLESLPARFSPTAPTMEIPADGLS